MIVAAEYSLFGCNLLEPCEMPGLCKWVCYTFVSSIGCYGTCKPNLLLSYSVSSYQQTFSCINPSNPLPGLSSNGFFEKSRSPSNHPFQPRAWADQRRLNASLCSMILPSTTFIWALTTFLTFLPVPENILGRPPACYIFMVQCFGRFKYKMKILRPGAQHFAHMAFTLFPVNNQTRDQNEIPGS